MAIIGRVLLMPKGDYSGTAVYNSLDWVRYDSKAWVCKVDNTIGVLPDVTAPEWQLLAQDGSVSGSVAWSAVTGKPLDGIATNGGIIVDGSNNIKLDPNYLIGSNIGYDNTTSQLTATNVQDAIDEIAQGGGGGDTVAWNQIQTSTGATKIATITINNTPTDVYAPSGGGGGASSLDDLSDVTITGTPTQGQILIANSSGIFENASAPADYDMINNANAISLLTSKSADPTDDDVASGYAIANWSNTDTITLLTPVAQGDDTMGTWEDDNVWESSGVRTGWLKHSALAGVLSDDDVEIELIFDVATSGGKAISALAYRIDDNISTGIGGIAIKFNAPLEQNATVGVKLKRNRTKTETIIRTTP